MDQLRWGILSTGTIARVFAKGVSHSRYGRVEAVASRSLDRASAFAEKFPTARAHASYLDLLKDPQIDAVYVATPHPQHAEWVIRAARAGKHILCEKPLGLNHAQVMSMLDAAAENGVFLMEAFMYRSHPQTRLIAELIQQGAIGELAHIEASFGFRAEVAPSHRLLNAELGGGGILDVGCYPVSMVRYIAKAALGLEHAEPRELDGHGRIGETGVDDWAFGLIKFPSGVSASVATGVRLALKNDVTLYGSLGQLHIPSPWHISGVKGGNWQLQLRRGKEIDVIEHQQTNGLYALEADEVARCIAQGLLESPTMNWQDSIGNSLVLDAWRKQLGLVYPAETPENFSPRTLAGSSLRPPRSPSLHSGTISGIHKTVSRLVMGCDNPPNLSHMAAMLDGYFELGGNIFDNAYVYGNGLSEKLLGQWLSLRGVRQDCVLIGKGAHTPYNLPAYIGPQLTESLERLQTDHVDIYFLHRDNLEVPVGEFVDALNEEVEGGRIRVFGGSNWTLERLQAANDYARRNGKRGFTVLSNNFSLARMNEPVWPGVEACGEPDYLNYLAEHQITLMPWSSQARGFFTPWGKQVISREAGTGQLTAGTFTDPHAEELMRVWVSEDNLERRRRAEHLSDKYAVDLINVALAYVFHQPFPIFPLIGPRSLTELRSCFSALALELSKEELDWLDLKRTTL